jgi:hypothetical protein
MLPGEFTEIRRDLEAIRDRAQAGDLPGVVQKVSAALGALDAGRLLTTTEAAAYLKIRSVNTLKLLIRRLNVPHEMHGSRMMAPIAALDAMQDDALVRGIRASDRAHDATAVLDDDAALTDDQLEALEQDRPGMVPWRAERPSSGQHT